MESPTPDPVRGRASSRGFLAAGVGDLRGDPRRPGHGGPPDAGHRAPRDEAAGGAHGTGAGRALTRQAASRPSRCQRPSTRIWSEPPATSQFRPCREDEEWFRTLTAIVVVTDANHPLPLIWDTEDPIYEQGGVSLVPPRYYRAHPILGFGELQPPKAPPRRSVHGGR